VKSAEDPVIAGYDGNLYVAWSEPDDAAPVSKHHIRVKKYTVSDGAWSWVDGGGVNGLNFDPSKEARRPALAVYGGNLYLAWDEYLTVSARIRVRRYDGDSTWTAVDGGEGLNHFTGGGDAADVTLSVIAGELYAAWDERNQVPGSEDPFRQIRVKKYNGATWTFVDHDHTGALCIQPGINQNFLKHGFRPRLIERNGAPYVVWAEEYGASNIQQLRAKCYGCDTAGTWTPVDGGGDTGLNYNTGTHANLPSLGVLNNIVYLAWYEGVEPPYNTGLPNVYLKSYNGSWNAIDGGQLDGGLDYGSLTFAVNPELLSHNHVLYVVWDEENDTTTYIPQIRVKKYNGSGFSSMDGGGTTGLNHNTGVTSNNPSLCVLNDNLYVVWEEGAPKQLRVKKLGLPSAGLAPDAALTELNLDSRSITVTLANTTFADATLSSVNFTLSNAPSGLTVENVSYTDSQHCQLNLAYDGTDLDADVTDLGLTIAGSELADGDPVTASNVLSIAATIETIPTVTTTDPPSVTATSATVAGNVTSDGNATVTERGIEYKKSTDGTYTRVAADTGGTGAYSVTITGLTASTAYNARAYAINEEGTATGDVIDFTTTPTAVTFRQAAGSRAADWRVPLMILALLGLMAVTVFVLRK